MPIVGGHLIHLWFTNPKTDASTMVAAKISLIPIVFTLLNLNSLSPALWFNGKSKMNYPFFENDYLLAVSRIFPYMNEKAIIAIPGLISVYLIIVTTEWELK